MLCICNFLIKRKKLLGRPGILIIAKRTNLAPVILIELLIPTLRVMSQTIVQLGRLDDAVE